MAYSGKYIPSNPKKYRGNYNQIIYRSLWERKLMVYCDNNEKVLEWGSEEVVIPYVSPWDNRIHRYFSDFYMKVRQANGSIKKFIIEVKPKSQTMPPLVKRGGKPTKKYLREVRTWGVNEAKWKSADAFCKDRGWDFKIMTEDNLGIK